MFKQVLRGVLKAVAVKAVESAEMNLGAGRGLQKKQFAVNYILARLNLPVGLKAFLGRFLVELLGEVVELAHSKIFGDKSLVESN